MVLKQTFNQIDILAHELVDKLIHIQQRQEQQQGRMNRNKNRNGNGHSNANVHKDVNVNSSLMGKVILYEIQIVMVRMATMLMVDYKVVQV